MILSPSWKCPVCGLHRSKHNTDACASKARTLYSHPRQPYNPQADKRREYFERAKTGWRG